MAECIGGAATIWSGPRADSARSDDCEFTTSAAGCGVRGAGCMKLFPLRSADLLLK